MANHQCQWIPPGVGPLDVVEDEGDVALLQRTLHHVVDEWKLDPGSARDQAALLRHSVHGSKLNKVATNSARLAVWPCLPGLPHDFVSRRIGPHLAEHSEELE